MRTSPSSSWVFRAPRACGSIGYCALPAACLLALAAFSAPAFATDGTWTGTSGNYSDTTNWSGGTVASGTGAIATFGSSTATVTLDSNVTLGTLTMSRSNPGWGATFTGSSSSNALTMAVSSGNPLVATNSYYNGLFYLGNMTVAGNQGLYAQSGYNTIVFQSGLNWTMTGTLTFRQPASDGTEIYAQGNNTLPGTMDVNMTGGSAGSLLVLNGGTTQTIGALTGVSGNFITAWSGNKPHGGVTPSGTNTLGTTSSATLQIGNTNASGTFAGVIGSTGSSWGSDTSAAAASVNLVKIGTGTQTLNGANTYTGSTTVSGGTLALGAGGSISLSSGITLGAGATLSTTAQTTFSLLGAQTITFQLDPTGSGSAGLLSANGLDITNGVVDFSALGTLDDSAYVLGTYTSLTGSSFLSMSNLPAGYTISYHYAGGNSIALVAVPEPADYWIGMMALLGLAVILRRRAALNC